MLTAIKIQNFKAFKRMQSARLGRITLLYGPNSSGKTSLLHALLALKATRNAGATQLVCRDDSLELDLGSSTEVAHGKKGDADTTIGIGFTRTPVSKVGERSRASAWIAGRRSCEFEFSREDRRGPEEDWRVRPATLERFRWAADEIVLEASSGDFEDVFEWDRHSAASLLSLIISRVPPEVAQAIRRANDALHQWTLPPGIVRGLLPRIGPIRKAVTAEPITLVWPYISEVIDEIAADLSDVLSSIAHIPPVRRRPERRVTPPAAIHRSQNNSLWHDFSKPQLSINDWLARFEIPYVFGPQVTHDLGGTSQIQKVSDVRNGLELTLKDVGYGVSQLLPIIEAAVESRGSCLCVEQPELHLHPRQQGHLTDFFIETTEHAGTPDEVCDVFGLSGPAQWIVETHSEAIVSRLQRRIREKAISPDDVSVLYVEPGPEGSTIVELRIDEDGQFRDEWPGGFFEETYWDLFGGVQ